MSATVINLFPSDTAELSPVPVTDTPAPAPPPAYKAPKEYAAEIRANIKAAQRSGELDSKWKISVRTEQASLSAEVAVNVQNVRDHIELFTKDDTRTTGRRWSDDAVTLAGQVRRYMAPAEAWDDGRMHFLSLTFGGLMAP